jgi:hypothetical protein
VKRLVATAPKSGTVRRRAPPRVRRAWGPLRVEQLEDRTLPATFDLSGGVAGYPASRGVANDLTLAQVGPSIVLFDAGEPILLSPAATLAGCTGGGSNTIRCPAAGVRLVTLNTVDGADRVTVRPAGLTAAVDVRNPGSLTDLVVDDRDDTTGRVVTLDAGSLIGLGQAALTFAASQLRSLTIEGGGGGNTFTVRDTPGSGSVSVTTTLDVGTGPNTVDVQATTGPLAVVGRGGHDTVTLGYQGQGAGGSLAGVRGAVSVRNTGPFTALTLDDRGRRDDQGNPAPTHGTITASQVTGQDPSTLTSLGLVNAGQAYVPAEVNFAPGSLSRLTVEGGGGGNTFAVADTGSGFTTTLDSGTGQDLVFVRGTTGPLVVDGQDGRDRVVLGQWNALPDSLAAPGSTVAQIRGAVTVRNDHSLTDLDIEDGRDTNPAAFSVSATQVGGSALATVTFAPAEINSLTVVAGSGGNTFTVSDTPAGPTTTLVTGSGDQVDLRRATGLLKIVDGDGSARVTVGQGAANVEHVLGRGTLPLTSDTHDTLAAATDQDLYTLNVDQAGYLRVALAPRAGGTLDGRLALLNSDSYAIYDGAGVAGGGLLATSDDRAPGDANPALSQYLAPGQYFVRVSAARSGGGAPEAYTLSTRFTPDANSPYDPDSLPPPTVAPNPQAIVLADFNNDGVDDLATVSPGLGDVSGGVTVLLGVGDSTLRLPGSGRQLLVPVAPGDHPDRILALDYNHDGRTDLATWDRTNGWVDILLGLGDGTFDAEHVIHVPAQDLLHDPAFARLFNDPPAHAVVSDFAHDGNLGEVSLVPLGRGTFASGLQVVAGIQQAANAVVQLSPLTDLLGGPVSGNGLITPGASTKADRNRTNPSRDTPLVAEADLNGRLVPYVVEVSRDGAIQLRLGVSGQPGSFQPPVTINDPVTDPAREIALVSGDPMHPQLAAITEGSSRLLVYTGTVDGATRAIRWEKTFDANLGSAFLPIRLAAGDLNGDGRNDLVVADALLGSVAVFLNRGDGTFRRGPDLKVGITVSDVFLSDPGYDGHADILVTDQVSGDVGVLTNARLPGPDAVGFRDELRFRAGVPPKGFGIDLSVGSQIANDAVDTLMLPVVAQYLDQLFAASGVDLGLTSLTPAELSALLGAVFGTRLPLYPGGTPDSHPDGELFPPLYFGYAPLETGTGVAADFTGDGLPSLVVTNRAANSFTLLQHKPGTGGSFIDPQPSDTFATGNQPGAVVAADFDGDGRTDLAVLNEGDNTIWIYKGDGHGGFTHTFTADAGTAPTGLAVADVGGGHVPDLLVGNVYGDLLELINKGDGTFQPPGDRAPVAVANLGGHAEALVGTQGGDRLTVQAQTSGGPQFRPVVTFAAGSSDRVLAPGDVHWLNLEGGNHPYPDAVVLDAGSNSVLVYRVTGVDAAGKPTFAAPESFPVGTNPVNVTVQALKGDGVPDLVVANQGSNDVSVLFGKVDANGNWTATPGPRLRSGGLGPVAVTVRDMNGDGIPDLVVTNGGSGTLTVLPGVGRGFFNDQNSQVLNLPGNPAVGPPTFIGTSGVGVVPAADGRLIGFDLSNFAATVGTVFTPPARQGVAAVQALDNGNLVVAEQGGTVELLGLNPGSSLYEPVETFTPLTGVPSNPSALAVLENASEVVVTGQGDDQLFVFGLAPGGPLTLVPTAASPTPDIPLPPFSVAVNPVPEPSAPTAAPLALVLVLVADVLPAGATAPTETGPAQAAPDVNDAALDAHAANQAPAADPAGDAGEGDAQVQAAPPVNDNAGPGIEEMLRQLELYRRTGESAGDGLLLSRRTLPAPPADQGDRPAAPGPARAEGPAATEDGRELPPQALKVIASQAVAPAAPVPVGGDGPAAPAVAGPQPAVGRDATAGPAGPLLPPAGPDHPPCVARVCQPGWEWEGQVLTALAAGGLSLWVERHFSGPRAASIQARSASEGNRKASPRWRFGFVSRGP